MTDPVTLPLSLAGLYADPQRLAEARALAERLGLPLLAEVGDSACLRLDQTGLALLPAAPLGPLQVDFVAGQMGHRRRFGGGRGQALARAVGLKDGANPQLIDATAGLGKDGLVLASLGCSVRLIERSPIIAALLADGLQRASLQPDLADWLARRVRLHPGDALELLPRLCAEQGADVIYLDPMFPERKKTALVKKEMRLLRQLLGDDADANELLACALGLADRRVVVKRPRLAAPLAGPKPDLVLSGKSTRYDVYLRH
ncbi:MAG: class I SAM-dependent methyltransferase [Gammaproteobacteria bacterium SHHR-1]|uniref:class I SAM-dependent methyltransferase n=1 Tax=Magnetovirga frankeli TaxID=947516 RepID=UPI001292FF18|nr:class I SAM-dependent methyltransferase [gamma proteobacterium SS-5]